MKRLIILLFIICGFSPLIWAVDGCNQERLSPEEFRAKQKAFIIENRQYRRSYQLQNSFLYTLSFRIKRKH